MESTLAVGTLWVLFAGSHLGLASPPLRAALVERLGRWGFTALFYGVASLCFAALVATYAAYRLEGPPGLGWQHGGLSALNVLALSLVGASLFEYPRSAYVARHASRSEPHGIERVTRHPFFFGMALLGAAHALLAPRLVGAVFMGGFTVFTLLGARLQDRKLLALRGAPYAEFLRRTSTLPFAAAISGRGRVVWRELPWAGLAVGVGLAFVLRAVHGALFDHGGAWVTGVTVGGAVVFAVQDYRIERRRAAMA